jgi:hypothetical protein
MDFHTVAADPMIEDPEKAKFDLQPDSPAVVAVFVSFDQSDVGPRAE